MDYDIVAAMVEDARRESTQIYNPDAPPSPHSTSPPATPSVSRSGPPPRSSASPSTPQGPFQGTRRIKIKINLSPKKSLGLTNDDILQIKFIPSPNSNIARNYNDLPWSPRMQKYIDENKKHLAELVAAEGEGYKARLIPEGFPPHKWVDFEYEADDSQEPLNDMLHLNFQLRIRCQAVKLMRRETGTGIYASGHEYEMRMFKMYKVFGTFPRLVIGLARRYSGYERTKALLIASYQRGCFDMAGYGCVVEFLIPQASFRRAVEHSRGRPYKGAFNCTFLMEQRCHNSEDSKQ